MRQVRVTRLDSGGFKLEHWQNEQWENLDFLPLRNVAEAFAAKAFKLYKTKEIVLVFAVDIDEADPD
jgi:hypothetical protein